MTVLTETPELNYTVLTGRIRKKGELKSTSFDIFVIRFEVENIVSYDKAVPEEDRKIYIISVEAWGNLAERIDRSITNGMFVLIEGSLVSRSYEDRSKGIHHRVILKASDVTALGT